MGRWLGGIAVAVLAVAALGVSGGRVRAAVGSAESAGGAPVVLELFTSQGCSSCPPADRLLSRLGSDPRWRGRLVPLAYHVDYWNSLGWADPFSSPEWSRRQQEYAEAGGARRVYTPQMVVDGDEECVGSEEDEVVSRIERARARPAGKVGLALRHDGETWRVDLDLLPPSTANRPLAVMLAVYESGLQTEVGRGENAGRRAADDYVVRRLIRVAELPPGGERHAVVELAIDPLWRLDRLGVAAFLQDPQSRVIAGAAAAGLPAR
ncbi:MAG: DUF1223 domain-containing protein [Acidobacteriota bacterium]